MKLIFDREGFRQAAIRAGELEREASITPSASRPKGAVILETRSAELFVRTLRSERLIRTAAALANAASCSAVLGLWAFLLFEKIPTPFPPLPATLTISLGISVVGALGGLFAAIAGSFTARRLENDLQKLVAETSHSSRSRPQRDSAAISMNS